jgi:Tannase-like family of unknown function (DUF6351)
MGDTKRVNLCAAALAITVWSSQSVASSTTPSRQPEPIQIVVLSGQPDRVSGGDALVQISVSRPDPQSFSVSLNGQDISNVFHEQAHSFVGLVSDLRNGENKLRVDVSGILPAFLVLTNYPIQGPIVSGPHVHPFICQTDAFKLPDQSTLGPALDADCSAPTRLNYVYMSTATKAFKPLPSTTSLPDDVAKTTTTTGSTVNFVVRLETATINRGIYQSAILYDPTVDPTPGPLSSPPAWNKVLIGIHGGGCPGGWYTQVGSASIIDAIPSWILDAQRLSQGYAIYFNTLQNPSNSCNPFLAGETAMMGKEHFIKTYGVPRYSLSIGGSGGAYTSLQVIDAFPGLFDGALIEATFPDAISIALSGMDGHLLTHFFTVTDPTGFTDAQQVAISGYKGHQAWYQAANQAGRTDPRPHRQDVQDYASAVWSAAVPESVRYDPLTNPKGARPTIWDVSKNIYGTDPETGFALRVFDNVGVQYGLGALNAGIITKAQFIEINKRIGGYDRDDNYVSHRTVADVHAIVEAYRSGVQLSGGGGLASVPIVDLSGTVEESAYYHYQWFHFAVRERLLNANGNIDNHVMWRGDYDSDDPNSVYERAFELINRWISSIKADRAQVSVHQRILENKPSEMIDGCWTASKPRQFIAETQSYGGRGTTQCNALWPAYAFPRFVAGGPLAANMLKCQLKPIDQREYRTPFSAEELDQLRSIFPQGTCDWTKPGVDFRGVSVGISYGPAPSEPGTH